MSRAGPGSGFNPDPGSNWHPGPGSKSIMNPDSQPGLLVLFAWANDIPVELQFNVATTHEHRLLKSK